jgi:hypothetical protein
MMTGLLNLLKSQERRIADVMTWVAFPLSVPLMRLTQDEKDERFKLFIRDFSTLFIGAGVFFMAKGMSGKLFELTGILRRQPETRRLLSLGTGLSANVLFSGLGAVKLSHWAQDRLSPQRRQASFESIPYTYVIKGTKRPVEMMLLPSFSGTNLNAVTPVPHPTTRLDVMSMSSQKVPLRPLVAPLLTDPLTSSVAKPRYPSFSQPRVTPWPTPTSIPL